MTQTSQPMAPFLDSLLGLLAGLPPAERRAALTQVARLLDEPPQTAIAVGAGVADRAAGNRAVVLCDWAADAGRTESHDHGDQLLRIDMRPGATQIAKTRQATGRPLLTNGFLGADLIHVPAGEGFAPHTHPGDHLLFVVGGRGTITAAGEILETGPGNVYMVDGAQPHAVGAITDHVLLSVGAHHQPLDSENRQELRPFEDLLTPEGLITCRICGTTAGGSDQLRAAGCGHSPVTFTLTSS